MSAAKSERSRRRPRPVHLCAGLLALGLGVSGAGLAQDVATTLTLPESTAEVPPELRVHVVVDQDAIFVDGVQVLRLTRVQDDDGGQVLAVADDEKRGQLITRLYDRMLEKSENEKLFRDAQETLAVLTQRSDVVHQGELLVSIDQGVPFAVVREVLYTAGQARWGTFLLVTHNPWEDADRTIEISLPAIGPPGAFDDDERPPLNLTMLVTDRGLNVLGADAVLFPDGAVDTALDDPAPTVPCVSGGACTGIDDYDWAELSRLLGLVKDEYPDDLSVIVVPESDISYDVIVRVMDHARWAPQLPMDAEFGAWEYWKSVRRELFSQPILAGGAS